MAQKGLESKVDAILNRLSQMQRLSCGGGQTPTVRVSVVASTPSGPVEAFDFAEYQPELLEKFRNMRSQHPYVLTADTLKVYQNKFRQASPDSVKVSAAPELRCRCSVRTWAGREERLRAWETLFLFLGLGVPCVRVFYSTHHNSLKCSIVLVLLKLEKILEISLNEWNL